MHSFGHTRSVSHHDHLLQTPDTFIRIPLPSIARGAAIVHVSPEHGAGFTQYTAELEATGTLAATAHQRFLYVLEGSANVSLGTDATGAGTHTQQPDSYGLRTGSYAYLPAGCAAVTTAFEATRLAVIEKSYQPHPTLALPAAFFGHEDSVVPAPLMGDADLAVRALLPGSADHDFAVNTMTYQPGASLAMVEIHVMEHGLLMLEGGGIYRLGEAWYPVTAGDFIWMAPYCPQWFGALGKQAAKYLIYKDCNRHPGVRR